MSIAWDVIPPFAAVEASSSPNPLLDAMRDSPALASLLRSADEVRSPVLLIVNDPHRATHTRAALLGLATLLKDLRLAHSFRVLVATGTHRFDDASRSRFEREHLTETGLGIEHVAWHDARDDRSLAPVGGFRFSRLLAESRFVIAIGSVEPHYFAGVTGPHKTATIGCLSFDDIERNHAGALEPESDVLRRCGNPVFDGIERMLAALTAGGRRILAVAEVACRGITIAAVAGEPLSVVESLMPAVRRAFVRETAAPVDVLHLRVPPPLGSTFYQADKALKNNHLAVRDGGVIILEAACEHGLGPDAFLSLLRETATFDEARELVTRRGYRLGDHKAVKLRHLLDPVHRRVRVLVVSPGLSPRDLAGTGIDLCPTLDAALGETASAPDPSPEHERRVPAEPRFGLVIDDAAMVTVRLAESATLAP